MKKILHFFLSLFIIQGAYATSVYVDLPLYLNAQISIQSLNLEIDSLAEIKNLETVSLDNNLINNKDSLPSIGNFNFEGNITQIISGKEVIFNKVLLNKLASNLETTTNLKVEDTIYLNSGIIDLNSQILNLGDSAYISNETDEHYITGFGSKIITQRNINNPTGDNIGGIGASITSSQNLGITTIERTNISFNIFGITSASRSYKIEPINNTNLDAILELQYLEVELNGLLQNSLALFQSTDNGSSWNLISTDLDSSNHTITASGLHNFHKYTFSNFTSTPLPVELISFDANLYNSNQVQLQWQTASEINNNYFEIERATSNFIFNTISEKVYSKGNGDNLNAYEFFDKNPLTGTNYYRLKQVDFDGSTQYSTIKKIDYNRNLDDAVVLNVYPSIIKKGEILYITTSDEQNQTKFLYLFTENGRLLEKINFNNASYSYPIEDYLQRGIYFVNLISNNQLVSTKKIIIIE